jgi:protein-S-isoprenylcysteine O-methyltransferase Ste14
MSEPIAPSPHGGIRAKSVLGLVRLVVVFAFLAALAWNAEPEQIDFWLGLPLVIAGGAARAWSAGYLLKTNELAITGPYAYTRNPLYLGRLLLLTGFTLMARLPYYLNLGILLVGYVVFFGYYLPRKERVECDRLRERHGAPYERYEAAVPALFPRLRPYRAEDSAARGGWQWSRFAHNREYLMILMEAGLIGWFAYLAFY